MKALKIALIAGGAFIVAAVVAVLITAAVMFTPVRTGMLADGFYSVNSGFVSYYIATDGTNAVYFDCGSSPVKIFSDVKGLPQYLSPARAQALFLTHSDRDHNGAAAVFSNATVYLAEKETDLLTGRVPRRMMGQLRTNAMPVPFKTFADGDTFTVGGIKVRAILAPGHTPGSTCFLVNDRYLVTGDLLVFRNGRAALSPSFLNNDDAEALGSISNLARTLTNIALTVSSHGGMTTDWNGAFAGYR